MPSGNRLPKGGFPDKVNVVSVSEVSCKIKFRETGLPQRCL